ncbi:unnamed protein product [Sphagnum troendelagicum]|uniref:RING-type E3 ubiquitin transferase n=1 Tax=Sphagnum troendelagicum TaxID=128251 RepID=A0ABP0TZ25_9BRYO
MERAEGAAMASVQGGGGDSAAAEKVKQRRTVMAEGDADDEEDVCRICRMTGEDDSPLYYPCACSGSIKYVHQECLLQWLNHSNARQCEVCKHPFSFSPVYADDAPAQLPFQELVLGMALKAGRGTRYFVRLAFVLAVWLLFIPFTTFWIWRFTFVRSFVEAQRLFVSRCVPSLLLTDCLHGFLLSAGIVLIFLAVTSLREYFRHLGDAGGGQDGDRDDEGVGVDRGHGGRVGRRHGHGRGADGQRLDIQAAVPGAGDNVEVAVVPAPQGLAAGAGQLLRRNAENVAAQLERQAARLEAHVEQMFDAVEDADGAEDVPFDELVGMQGPVFHLVENAITVLASNAIFLGLVALVPFTLGRLVLSIASRLVVATAASELGSNTAPMAPIANPTFLANVERIDSNSTMLNHIVGVGISSGASGGHIWDVGNTIDVVTEAMVIALKLSDAATVAVGYGVIFLALSFYLCLIALIRYTRGQPITVGRIHGVTTMAEAAPSVVRQMIAGVRYMATMVKVAFLLVIELGVFPLLCGWWLDICTLGMLEATISHRVAFFWSSPLTSSLLHWLVGIVYMLQISIFVSLLREVLRPGVLYFLRDPADPNYNPFRDLIDDPLHKHARRVLLSVVVYGSLIVMLVFLPIRLSISIAPHMFPFDIRVSDPFTEIPADMLLFHICIPFAVEHFRPRATIKTVLFHWFSAAGWALGLSEFLLPGPDVPNVDNNHEQHRRVGVQDQPHAPPHEINNARARVAGPADAQASSDNDEEMEDADYEEAEVDEYKFAMRIVLLLFGAWVTLLAFNSTMVLLPVSLGRAIFASFSQLPITRGAKCNDLYAFNIGCYVLWATSAAVRYVVDYLRTHDLRVLLRQVLKWSSIIFKSVVLLSLWTVVIPVLIGLLFELVVVVPLRVPVDESPVFLLYQDWALGLVFLKIWTRLVMLGQMMPLVDDSWRVKFEQVRLDGFSRLRGWWVFTSIIVPILVNLLTALCLPYVLACGIFPLFGYSLIINSTVYRFAWLGSLLLGLCWYGTKRLHKWLLDLHNSIRDDRYLVGRRLHNFGERRRVGSLGKQPPNSVAGLDATSKVVVEQEPRVVETDAAAVSGLNSGVSGEATEVRLNDAVDENIIQEDCREVKLANARMESGDRRGGAGSSLQLRHVVPSLSTTGRE